MTSARDSTFDSIPNVAGPTRAHPDDCRGSGHRLSLPGGLEKIGTSKPRYRLEVAVLCRHQEVRRLWVDVPTAEALASWKKMKPLLLGATNVVPFESWPE